MQCSLVNSTEETGIVGNYIWQVIFLFGGDIFMKRGDNKV